VTRLYELPLPILMALIVPQSEGTLTEQLGNLNGLSGGALVLGVFWLLGAALDKAGVWAALRRRLWHGTITERKGDRFQEVLDAISGADRSEDEMRADIDAENLRKARDAAAVVHRQRSQDVHAALLDSKDGVIPAMLAHIKAQERQALAQHDETRAILGRMRAIEGIGTNVNALGDKLDDCIAELGKTG